MKDRLIEVWGFVLGYLLVSSIVANVMCAYRYINGLDIENSAYIIVNESLMFSMPIFLIIVICNKVKGSITNEH